MQYQIKVNDVGDPPSGLNITNKKHLVLWKSGIQKCGHLLQNIKRIVTKWNVEDTVLRDLVGVLAVYPPFNRLCVSK